MPEIQKTELPFAERLNDDEARLLNRLVLSIKKDIQSLYEIKLKKNEEKLINRLFTALHGGDTCLAVTEDDSLNRKICATLQAAELSDFFTEKPGDQPFYTVEYEKMRYLYLHRQLSETVAINRKLAELSRFNEQSIIQVEPSIVEKVFSDLPGSIRQLHDKQKLACLLPLYSPFTVISGGPGTGKTSVVATLLRLILDSGYCKASEIRLCAPTGKAARRLSESITGYFDDIGRTELIDALGATATIHRLLQYSKSKQTFRRNSKNPLSGRILIVDEVSMIDLSLLKSLLEAVPYGMRVIMLGDPAQLPPVDKGDTLSDIVPEAGAVNYSKEFIQFTEKYRDQIPAAVIDNLPSSEAGAGQLHTDSAVVLTESHRSSGSLQQAALSILNFSEETGLENLLNSFSQVDNIDENVFNDGVFFLNTGNTEEKKETAEVFLRLYTGRENFSEKSPEEQYRIFENCKILTFLKRGPEGSEELNRQISVFFRQIYGGKLTEPVMARVNDYRLDLFNGDTGIVDSDNIARFESADGSFNDFPAESISSLEKAYAITVHKSQGSEYEHVLIILPDNENRMLNRQILFTALTRAKKSAVICGSQQALENAVLNKSRRETGIGLRF